MSREDTKNFGDIFREFYDVITQDRLLSEDIIKKMSVSLTSEDDSTAELLTSSESLSYAIDANTGLINIDLLKIGNYKSKNNDSAKINILKSSVPQDLITNDAINRGFRLTVMHGGSTDSWLQIMFCNDSKITNDPMIFIRDAFDDKNTPPSQYSKWQLLTIGGDSKIEKIEQIIKDQQSKIQGVQNRTMSLSVGLSHALIKNHVTDIWQPAEFDEIPDANELQEPGILYFKSNIKLCNNFPDNINLGGSYFINIGYKPKNTNSKQYASLVQIVLPLDGALWMRRRDMNTEYTNWINIAKGGIDETNQIGCDNMAIESYTNTRTQKYMLAHARHSDQASDVKPAGGGKEGWPGDNSGEEVCTTRWSTLTGSRGWGIVRRFNDPLLQEQFAQNIEDLINTGKIGYAHQSSSKRSCYTLIRALMADNYYDPDHGTSHMETLIMMNGLILAGQGR